MIKGSRFALVVMMLMFVAACASREGPSFALPAPPADQVTIYAFRTASIVGGGNTDIVAVNDRFIGRLKSGSYAVYRTDPGPIRITRKAGSIFGSGDRGGWGPGAVVGYFDGFIEEAVFDGKANEIYFIRFPQGEMVPREVALPLMNRLEDVTATN